MLDLFGYVDRDSMFMLMNFFACEWWSHTHTDSSLVFSLLFLGLLKKLFGSESRLRAFKHSLFSDGYIFFCYPFIR